VEEGGGKHKGVCVYVRHPSWSVKNVKIANKTRCLLEKGTRKGREDRGEEKIQQNLFHQRKTKVLCDGRNG